MNMKVTRRDLFALAGGSAVGLALSPAPWKLLDDLSIWTQNWKWIPRPPKGPVTFKNTRCPSCQQGCAVQARCVGEYPVSLHAAEGALPLCPLGMTAHHLRYHPARLSSSVRIAGARAMPASSSAIANATARAIASATKNGRSVAVLDARPGRSSTSAWRRWLGQHEGGVLIPAPGREGASLTTMDRMLGVAPGTCAVDLTRARVILSFGAPIAEGWGSPATAALLSRKPDQQRLISVEPNRSKTAALAHQWIPARPGSEGALALALAHVLLDEGLVHQSATSRIRDFEEFKSLVSIFSPELAALAAGVPTATIVSLARELAHGPAVVFAGEEPGSGRFGQATETAIFALNTILGSVDLAGGIVRRSALPEPFDSEQAAPTMEIEEIADGSIGVLIIDDSGGEVLCPWPLLRRKLVDGALVVALSPFLAGSASRAHYVVATPAPLESIQETGPGPDMVRSCFAISNPLRTPPAGAVDPMAFLAQLAAECNQSAIAASTEEVTRLRCNAIFGAHRGEVRTSEGEPTALSAIDSPDALWEAIAAGGIWMDEERREKPPAISLTSGMTDQLKLLASAPGSTNARRQLSIVARVPRDVAASAAVSPVLTKLYQESGLRRAPFTAVLNSRTIAELSLRDGKIAELETAAGTVTVTVIADDAVMPRVAEITIGPDERAIGLSDRFANEAVLDAIPTDSRGVWRYAAASLVEG